MKAKNDCPLNELASCRGVPEHHDPVDTAGAPFRPGQVLDGRFLITEILSRSGMATIFKAQDQQRGNQFVALKVPHFEYESDPTFFSRFQREERIGLELNHPFVLKFVAVENKSRPYLVTEYLKGCTLEHMLKAMKPLPEKDALKIASLICEALQHLHDHGVIHRDLKPQNVMICCDGTIRLMDFGLARDTASRRITRVGNSNSMGTPDYMAPEQVTGKRADKRTDIYGLGALLYEMLAGAVPFQDENPWAALNARVTGDPVAPRKLNPDLSAQAEEIVLRALQRDPADRYESAAAMKAELDTAEHVRVTGLADRLQAPETWRTPLFQRPLVLATAMLSPVAIGIIVMVVLLLRRHAGAP
jgi:serine/threonine-protein kinase